MQDSKFAIAASALALIHSALSVLYGTHLLFLSLYGGLGFLIADSFLASIIVLLLLDGLLLHRLYGGLMNESVLAVDTLFYYFLITRGVVVGYKLAYHSFSFGFLIYLLLFLASVAVFAYSIFAIKKLHTAHKRNEAIPSWFALGLLALTMVVFMYVLVHTAPSILLINAFS